MIVDGSKYGCSSRIKGTSSQVFEFPVRCGRCEGCLSYSRSLWCLVGGSGFTKKFRYDYDFFFITITAPPVWLRDSEGKKPLLCQKSKDDSKEVLCPVHRDSKGKKIRHPSHYPFSGRPADLDLYDYKALARYNRVESRLFNLVITKIRQAVPQVEFFGCREVQSGTGASHRHYLVRVPKGSITKGVLYRIIRGSESSGVRYGRQVKIEGIRGSKNDYLGSKIGYIVKYISKGGGSGLYEEQGKFYYNIYKKVEGQVVKFPVEISAKEYRQDLLFQQKLYFAGIEWLESHSVQEGGIRYIKEGGGFQNKFSCSEFRASKNNFIGQKLISVSRGWGKNKQYFLEQSKKFAREQLLASEEQNDGQNGNSGQQDIQQNGNSGQERQLPYKPGNSGIARFSVDCGALAEQAKGKTAVSYPHSGLGGHSELSPHSVAVEYRSVSPHSVARSQADLFRRLDYYSESPKIYFSECSKKESVSDDFLQKLDLQGNFSP